MASLLISYSRASSSGDVPAWKKDQITSVFDASSIDAGSSELHLLIHEDTFRWLPNVGEAILENQAMIDRRKELFEQVKGDFVFLVKVG